MSDCIFCKISRGEIPCYKIWEDENFLAFLDINPVTEGMALVIPKEHKNSAIFQNSDEDITNIMLAAKKVSKLLENTLDIERVGVIFEGIEVDHLHIKLIPIKTGENIKSLLNSDFPKLPIEEFENLSQKIFEQS
ncbi:HIT domain-containing protein [Patescibacteria group bacterium]|nr:HIT domain-containing protein [Patescibacteria group bacterium]